MKRLTVAIGSLRPPKVDAVIRVFQQIFTKLGVSDFHEIEFVTRQVPTDVSHTPSSQEELMRGAENRVIQLQGILQKENINVNFFIGLEGGFHTIRKYSSGKPEDRHRVFLQSWTYVSNGREGYYGASGMIEVPHQIVQPVLQQGEELSKVIDQIMEQRGIRDRQGTWGVLTDQLLTRQDSFHQALLAAMAPFYNSRLFRT